MSNHYSAANLKFPGDDARLDFTDLFLFTSPEDPDKTVLIVDINPYTTGMSAMPPFLMKSEFHPDGIYRINIDTDGDAKADAAFTLVFSELKDGAQTGTVHYATGPQARDPEPNRGGHPTINPFVSPNNTKNEYNRRQPVDDVANYLEIWSKFLEANGAYSPEEARTAALVVLPDILRYDRSQPVAYPNGRSLTGDAFSARFAWMSNGKIGSQGLKPHDDLLAEFPYLGVPNVYPV